MVRSWPAVTLGVTPSGLRTQLIPDAGGLDAHFDFGRHQVRVVQIDGRRSARPLASPCVSDFLKA
jgi:Family of unknown function (DUF5996)